MLLPLLYRYRRLSSPVKAWVLYLFHDQFFGRHFQLFEPLKKLLIINQAVDIGLTLLVGPVPIELQSLRAPKGRLDGGLQGEVSRAF